MTDARTDRTTDRPEDWTANGTADRTTNRTADGTTNRTADGTADRTTNWTVVLPLKGGRNAKSRLAAPPQLATAIALDCLDAVLAGAGVGRVVVVTLDPGLGVLARAAGASVRAESAPGSGLRAAIRDGLAEASGRCAVLLGDLPALRPDDLDAALRLAGERLRGTPASAGTRAEAARPGEGLPGAARPGDRLPGAALPARVLPENSAPPMVFVPDAEGTGTVLLAALDPAVMTPRFGTASAAAHEAAGALRLELELPRLRRDVDTQRDLRTALTLGVGPRTRAVLAELAATTA